MRDAPVWNSSLITSYSKSGPRYTSYPTAVQFTESFQTKHYESNSWYSAITKKPLSLYIHIPFCTHICYYCACNKIITKHKDRADQYLEMLFREIEMQAELFGPQQPVEQMHFGGGTPTFLNETQLTALINKLKEHFNLGYGENTDYSIELDPREVDWPMMYKLSELGFNRVSIGVQDLNPIVQQAVNRVQSEAQISSVVDAARAHAFKSIHMDLIYGLPHQTPDSFKATVNRIIDYSPNRLSLFNYAHLPHRFKPQRRINENHLPSPDQRLNILQQSTEQLLAAGYVYIGMDHFALPDDDLAIAQEEGTLHRNFQGYTTHRHCDLIGLGISSISKVGNVYTQNHVTEAAYNQCINDNNLPHYRGLVMSADDQIRQAVINELICHFRLNPTIINQAFGINFKDYFTSELEQLKPMKKDGLLEINDKGLLN